MSATNRGSTKRRAHDYYQTPDWCTQAVLDYCGEAFSGAKRILDPGCGIGEIFSVVLEDYPNLQVVGVEIQRRLAKKACGRGAKIIRADFLKTTRVFELAPYDVIIMNPPFSFVVEFWALSMTLLKPGGSLLMFGRTGTIEGRLRRFMFDRYDWRLNLALPKRAFADAATYSWFWWQKGWLCDQTQTIRAEIPGYEFSDARYNKEIAKLKNDFVSAEYRKWRDGEY